jgi:hypothetical protein
MKYFHEEFEKDIIEEKAAEHREGVAEQLNPACYHRPLEYHVPVQQESDGECHAEGKQEGCDMRADGHEWQMHHLFPEDEIVTDEEQEDVKQCIRATAGRITICHPVHEPAEKGIRLIEELFYNSGHTVSVISAKVEKKSCPADLYRKRIQHKASFIEQFS